MIHFFSFIQFLKNRFSKSVKDLFLLKIFMSCGEVSSLVLYHSSRLICHSEGQDLDDCVVNTQKNSLEIIQSNQNSSWAMNFDAYRSLATLPLPSFLPDVSSFPDELSQWKKRMNLFVCSLCCHYRDQ
jgi:hypothetical protein